VTQRQVPDRKNPLGSEKKKAGKKMRLSADIQADIGAKLRAMYNDVVDQGIPDRFANLVNQIEAARDRKDKQADNGG
jgi:Anti-sigma factor NepR